MTTVPGNEVIEAKPRGRPRMDRTADPKQIDYAALSRLRCPIKEDELFLLSTADAYNKIADWLDSQEIGEDEKAKELVENSLSRVQKYFYCKGVFESMSDRYKLRIGRQEDGKDIKALAIEFVAGKARSTTLSLRHRDPAHSAAYGIYNLEMNLAMQEDSAFGMPIQNLAITFAEKSDRKISHDFLKMFEKDAEFVKACNGVKFRDAYASASTADKTRIALIARRLIVENVIQHKDN